MNIRELDPYWRDIVDGINAARRNLREIQPGFASTTPGNGSPGGGSGAEGSITERLALKSLEGFEDVAARDLARLEEMISKVIPNHRELRDLRNLIVRWNYLVPGQINPGLLARTAAVSEPAENEARWCKACRRLKHMEPIGKHGRAGYCSWCYRFYTAEGIEPPDSILELHHQGRRISEAQVKAAVREAKKAAAAQTPNPPRKKRSELLPPNKAA